MMRRTKWARADKAARIIEQPRHAVDARRFDGFFERHGRQDRRDALGKHRFPRARRPDEDDVVPAGAGDFERALGGMLAADVPHIDRILCGVGQHRARVHANRRERFRRVDQVHGLRKRAHGEDVDAFDHRCLAHIGLRHDHRANAMVARRERR